MVRGLLLEKGAESVVVDAGGLAYEVFVPAPALAALSQPGQEISLYTHFHVREDAQILYGFMTPSDRRVFLLLLTVKGVGPKVALGILSKLNGPVLAAALLKRDLAVLTQVPGVGKKLAERLGVELSDKVSGLDFGALGGQAPGAGGAAQGPWDQAVAALLALGYPQNQARQAVDAAFRNLGKQPAKLEDIVKAALKAV